MPQQTVIIDCDTGMDDALALLLALRTPACDVLGITTVGGNVPLPQVMRNTLVMVEHAGREVPVYRGLARPLLAPPITSESAHGSDGLGDIGFPDPQREPAAEHAVDFLIRTFMAATAPITLITLAPLTNIALALLREPRLEERIPHLVMMAGSITGGNTTAVAEFNVYADVEAADIVFRSRIPKTMVSLDPIRKGARLYEADAAQIEAGSTPWGQAFARLLRRLLDYRKPRPVTPPDLAAVAVALEPALATGERWPVAVETRGQYTRGMTVVDTRRRPAAESPEPHVNVITAIDHARFQALVLATLTA